MFLSIGDTMETMPPTERRAPMVASFVEVKPADAIR
jgi:hypothetical protein